MKICTQSIRAYFSQVVLNYKDLKAGKNLQDAIEIAYGPKGKT